MTVLLVGSHTIFKNLSFKRQDLSVGRNACFGPDLLFQTNNGMSSLDR